METVCQTGTPAADDATCDDVDNDCDGTADEDYLTDESCFLPGACSASNAGSTCVAGVETACQTGTPAADDATCDGVDDDCDGTVDDNFVSQETFCGIGDCWSTGNTLCVAGVIEDTCQPLPPGPNDFYCDGIDEDCDGVVDEDFPLQSTTCGLGGCESSGEIVCVAGEVVDTCTPGTPAADDSLCNGVDDDCEGVNDEEYDSLPTACGLGACSSSGEPYCVSGSV